MPASKLQAARWTSALLLAGSVAVSALTGALLMTAHAPAAIDRAGLRQFLDREPHEANSWRAIHILAAGCNCSRALARHLAARGPLKDLRESVVIAGSDRALRAELAAAGFRVTTLPAEEAAERYHLRGAPWLVFVSPEERIAYAGGYAATAYQGEDGFQEEELWKQLRAGRSPHEFPAFGCLTSRRLQRRVDPFGLKY